MGNIVEVLENGLSVAKYEYDALGRLKREDNKHFAKTTLFSYDDNGNILAKYEYALTNVETDDLNTIEPTRTVLYGYDEDSDRLLTVDDSLNDNVDIFEYDDIGNPTTYRGKSATWSCGREMTGFDGNTFAYDARGRRVSKNDIRYNYDSNGKLIGQYRKEYGHRMNNLDFLYDHTGLLAVEYDGVRYFYRKNAQNDIIALLDNEGNVVVKYIYDAWGNCTTVVINENATDIANLNPFRYRSYYLDTETNLYFLKTRYYDPELCRFITIDDISYIAPDTINGLNLYAYCLNNPIMFIDPYGKWTISHGISISAVFIVGISISFGWAYDDDGNVALQFSYAIPFVQESMFLGVLGVGLSGYVGGTNFDTVYDLEGPATYFGASGGAGLSVGLDLIAPGSLFDIPETTTDSNKEYIGGQLLVGCGLGVDIHSITANTINLFNFNVK